ncbi:MAG: transporter substrate-binding domain-containing protein [Clostridiales bacterium]|nr:transporter substrate-binding domain-containing protein [Clostridiales bacterium]
MKSKKILALALTMGLALTACGGGDSTASSAPSEAPEESAAVESAAAVSTGVEDGVLTVGMECAYAPYNWTQADDSNGAVPISNVPGSYANGYDVMIAKKVCEDNGWELEIVATAWDSLIPALQAGTLDAIIAGQSMTEERMQQVDMAGPYYYATFVCVTKADGPLADAKGLSDLSGTATAQTGTDWYEFCLPQIEGADIQSAAETAPAMIMAVESGTVDFICTDMPTAMGAVATYPDLKILDFSSNPEDDFQFADEAERDSHINIGMSVAKGNTVLLDALNASLATLTTDDFESMMKEAVSIQPEI